jgi:hypothetical protein
VKRFLRRTRRPVDPAAGIAAFWEWWPGARPRIEAAIDGDGWPALTGEIADRVHAVHPELDWEFGTGRHARHALVLSTAGAVGLRSTTERWVRAGPPPDADWEFHPARQADPVALTRTLRAGDHAFDLARLRVGYADTGGRQYDVAVHHPDFADLPADLGRQVAFLALDWLLGEDAVEAWVAAIDVTTDPALADRPAAELRDAVERLADAPPVWTLLGANAPDGTKVTATVQTPLRPVRWPLFDQHLSVVLGYPDLDRSGMPGSADLDALRAFEDSLTLALDHSAALVAHETAAGRRTLHLFTAAGSPAEQVAVRLAAGWTRGAATVGTGYDPTWSTVAHLRS